MKHSRTYLSYLLALFLIGGWSGGQLFARGEAMRRAQFNLENGVAIKGYDPVSYFTVHHAVKGNPAISLTHRGIIYYFASKKNRELFQKDPDRYEPEYGGWCAYAMGDDGSKVEIDPETFKIVNGKLFLFYNFYLINTRTKWNKDEARLKARADRFWAGYIKK